MIPDTLFIIPYRDREMHKRFFIRHMSYIMEDIDPESYKIFFIHQQDDEPFNRGAMKNIGFLVGKKLYPNDYRNITFVFHDIDTFPFEKNTLNYKTTENVVKHFYGFTFTLGGIVSILGSDFEKINGFPNFWSWGYEDNTLQDRVLTHKMKIDRSVFYPVLSKDFMHLHHGAFRDVNPQEKIRYKQKTDEGLTDVTLNDYTIDDEVMVNVTSFKTKHLPRKDLQKTKALGVPEPPPPLMKMNMTSYWKKPRK